MRRVDRKIKMMSGPAENKAERTQNAAKEGAGDGGKEKSAGKKRADSA